MRWVLALAALLLVAPLHPVSAGPSLALAVLDDERVVGFEVTDDHLQAGASWKSCEGRKPLVRCVDVHARGSLVREARSLASGLAGAAPDAPRLEVLATFAQPAVRGEDALFGALGIVAAGGDWRGVYWVDAGEASVDATAVSVTAEGRIFQLHGGADLSGASLRATYHFLGVDGRELVVALPEAPILEATPDTDRVVVAGAALGREHNDLPRLLFLSAWNQLGVDAPMGFDLLDANGTALSSWLAGGCTAETYGSDASEAGCRALFIVEPGDAAFARTWSGTEDARVDHEIFDLRSLADAPYVART